MQAHAPQGLVRVFRWFAFVIVSHWPKRKTMGSGPSPEETVAALLLAAAAAAIVYHLA